MTAAVTVVLATYGRPQTLACAVRSVLHQTLTRWRLLVIGDGCGEETASAMAPFLADSRIRYVNMPWRCGEQPLPNSAGMACANTDTIAFLNHDDLWLPSHLSVATTQLAQSGANFFFGRSAWVWEAPTSAQAPLAIDTVSPLIKDFRQVFTSDFHGIEPVSAWVLTRELAEKVGPWHPSSALFRTSIQDWFLRACRAQARVSPGHQVTCLKFENQWSADAPIRKYDTPATPQESALEQMQSPGELEALTRRLHTLTLQLGAVGRRMHLDISPVLHPDVQRITQLLITPQAADYYLQTGLDAYSWLCAEVGLQRGWRWAWTLSQRTGETQLTPPPFADVAAHVRQALTRQPWNERD